MDTLNSRLDDRLLRRAGELRRLTALLRNALPPESDGHYHVANIRDRTVVIMTDSPVWTTRLRQLGPRILALLHDSGRKNLLHIRVFSRPSQVGNTRAPRPVVRQPKRLSRQSRQLIQQTASYIADEDLQRALRRLAERATDTDLPEGQR